MKLTQRSPVLMLLLALLISSPAMSASKLIGILVYDGVLTSDITGPLEVFGVADKKSWFSDYNTITINVGKNDTITTEEGLRLKVDNYLHNSPEVDVIIVPSSYDMAPLLSNQEVISYLQKTASKAEWIASNCSGAFLLAEAGLLNNKKATTWAGGEQELQSAYPKVKVQFDKNYVIDGNVITSNGSLVSYEAALALLTKLSSESHAQEVKETLQMQRVGRH